MKKYIRVRYRVISLDVWGNAKDGFEVNAAYRTNQEVECTAVLARYNEGKPGEFYQYEPRDKYMVRALKEAGVLRKGTHTKTIAIDGENDATLYVEDARNGEPLWHLECLEPEKVASVVVTPYPAKETGT